jgi:hypothetical protein
MSHAPYGVTEIAENPVKKHRSNQDGKNRLYKRKSLSAADNYEITIAIIHNTNRFLNYNPLPFQL